MEVFFYGLFMDQNILLKNRVMPSNPRTGYLNNFALKIGTRASLIPCKGEKSYGILMTVDKGEIQTLYAEASVSDYLPEEVNVITNTHESIKAVCYNLPSELLTGTNVSYAKSLYELAKQKGFPNDYLGKIKKMTKTIA